MLTDPPPQHSHLGDDLRKVCGGCRHILFRQGQMVQFAYDAFGIATAHYRENPTETIKLHYPIGLRLDGTIITSDPADYTKEQIETEYRNLQGVSLPVTAIYQLVTVIELWQGELLRLIVRRYPKKLGAKRQIPLGVLLSSSSLDDCHKTATEHLLNELSYLSPQEFAKEFEQLTGVDMSSKPPFWRYAELKATRDIWIHSGGVANETYCRKAASHARVKRGQFLPVTIKYFLEAYETCLQLVDDVEADVLEKWPPTPDAAEPLFGHQSTEQQAKGDGLG